MLRSVIIGFFALIGLVGCEASGKLPIAESPADIDPATDAPPPEVQQLAPITIAAYSTEQLLAELERGRSHLLVDEFDQAAHLLDRLAKLATDPKIVALARYNSGLAHEGMGQRERAAKRYREVVDEHGEQPIARHALVRLTRVLGYLEDWPALQQAAEQLLAYDELPVMDRIEGFGARALALIAQGEIDAARIAVGKAQALVEKHGFGRSGTPPPQLAQVSFAEGELRRIASEKIKLTPVPPNFPEVLEARCQGLLDAQAAYTEAMRARDAHWSAMSGYRVGELYHQLHREAMDIPPPEGTTLEQKQLFSAAMRLRYRILLEKGLKMMAGTVRLGERTGEDSYWIARAEESKRQLEQALEDEKAALAKTPYSEEEIRAALEKLKGEKPKP